MSTRITITVEEITIGASNDGNRTIVIFAGKGTNSNDKVLANNDVWNENDGTRITNTVNGAVGTPDTLRFGPDGTKNAYIENIEGIKLTLPDALAELVYYYIQWKGKIKDKKGSNNFTITFKKINYDDVITTVTSGGLPNSFPDLDDDCLVLDENSFCSTSGGPIDSWQKIQEIVEINNFDNTQPYDNTDKKDFDGTPGSANDPSEKQVFANLVRIYQQIFNSSIPSAGDLDSIIQELNNFKTTDDIDYDHNNTTNITADNAKKTIYRQKFLEVEENHGGNKNRVWKNNINKMINLARELKVWRKIGFSSLEEVLQANANGYLLISRKNNVTTGTTYISDGKNPGNLDETTSEGASNIQTILAEATDNQSIGLGGAKYKGFPIIDRQLIKKKRISNKQKRKSFMVIENNVRHFLKYEEVSHCERKAIDNLRKLEVKDSGGNEVSKLSVFKDINRVDKKDLFGFEPGDIDDAGEYKGIDLKDANVWKVAKDGKSSKDHQMTKVKFQLKKCKQPKEICELFLGDIDSAQTGGGHYLDEFGSHQTTLEEYYDFVKNSSEVPLNGKNYENDEKVAKTIDLVYQSLREWAVIWDKDYSQKNEQECQKDKKTLKNFLGLDLKKFKNIDENEIRTKKEAEVLVALTSRMLWGNDFIDKMSQIDNRLETIWKGGNKDDIKKQITDFLATGAGKNFSTEGQKVFSENINEITAEIFNHLKILVPLLETAHGSSGDNLTELEKYSTAEESKAGEKDLAQSWAMTNKIGIENGKGWGERGLEKMTNKVVVVRTAAKTLLDEVDKDNAYNAIGIANIKKISEINTIKDLFTQAKKGYAMTSQDSDDFESVLKNLDDAKKADNEAWKKVNQYKKNDQKVDYHDGYAVGAWKKLEEFKKKAVADFNKVKAATTETEMENLLQGVIEAATDTKTKERWEKVDGPRLKARFKLNQNDNEEKELYRILGVNVIDSSEYTNDEEGLTKIEQDITKLNEYKDAKSDDEKGLVFAKIKTISEIDHAITEFIKQMESKKSAIKAEVERKRREEGDNPNNPATTDETPWYKSPYFIGFAIVAGIALLGAIVYFMQKDGNESVE